MTRTIEAAALLALLAALSGCDYIQQGDLKEDRADRHYQSAMSDYGAGRIDAAMSGFEKAIKANPGNASARFQLACLLQDRRQDYLGAICNYREYIRMEPSSEKVKMARDRAALCERQLAMEMAKKHNLSDVAAAAKAEEAAKKSLADYSRRLEESEKRASALASENESLKSENVRLRRMIATVGEDSAPRRMRVEDAKNLLDDDEGDRLRVSPEAKALFAIEDEEDAPDIATGARAASAGESADGPAILRRDDGEPQYSGPSLVEMSRSRPLRQKDASEPPHEDRPEFYVVQEGDTLYRIALRFYGRRDAWKKIQGANRAVISSDARIKVGQKIRLP